MAFECKSLTCDEGLAKTLEMLEKAQAALKDKDEEIQRLRKKNEKLRLCMDDYKRAELESHEVIATLKGNKSSLLEEMAALTSRNSQLDKALRHAKQQLLHQEHSMQRDDTEFLKQQLKVYQEDFAAERREKERLKEEKENERLRLQAEVTSLQLQLDRCRTELTHYSSETTRLAHQLKIRCQADQEQYRRSLEGKGYVPRSPDNGLLPPLDPYVELDTEPLKGVSIDPAPREVGPCIARNVPDRTGEEPVALPGVESSREPACPRCAKRFVQWAELEDHKTRCLQY